MIRWGRPTKNKKRRDPRYFLNEAIDYSKLFDEDTGEINRAILDDIMVDAAGGDKRAQILLALQATNIKKLAGLNFNTEDGTKMDKASIIKQYGLNQNEVSYDTLNKLDSTGGGETQKEPPAQPAQEPQGQEKNAAMIKLIQIKLSRETDPAKRVKLQKKLQHFKSQI